MRTAEKGRHAVLEGVGLQSRAAGAGKTRLAEIAVGARTFRSRLLSLGARMSLASSMPFCAILIPMYGETRTTALCVVKAR